MSNRLRTKLIVDWLKPQVTTGAVVVTGRIPDIAKRFIAVYQVPGTGPVMEDMFDNVGFQLSCHGGERNLDDAERIALQIDSAILNGPDNFQLGAEGDSVWVNGLGRVGGSPLAQPLPDAQGRFICTATYYLTVSTNVGMVN